MNTKTKETLSRVVWGTVKSILFAFGVYAVCSIFLVLTFYEDTPPGQRDFTPIHYSMIVIFGISFYLAYLKKYSEEQTIQQKDSFCWKEELTSFVQRDGKYLFVHYGILAVLNELGYFLNIVPITTGLYPCFSMSAVIPVPVLRSVAAYVVIMIVILATALLKHYKEYKYWSNNGKKPEKNS